jgi:hypothetical protein
MNLAHRAGRVVNLYPPLRTNIVRRYTPGKAIAVPVDNSPRQIPAECPNRGRLSRQRNSHFGG